jgi:hypothetical protein
MNRKIFYCLVFNRQIQLELPFTSLAKAVLAFIYQRDGNTLDGLCFTEENKSFLFELSKALLQILMSQTTEEQEHLVFCCLEHEDSFKHLLNGAKIYVNHRDTASCDEAALDLSKIEVLKSFHKLMTFWLTSIKETDNKLILDISKEELPAKIASKETNSPQGDNMILSLINLENDIAIELVEKCDIHPDLQLNPIKLSEEKHQDLEDEFPFLKYRDDGNFVKLLGAGYLGSKLPPYSSILAAHYCGSIIEPIKVENPYADGQTMLYSVLLKNELNLSKIAGLMKSLAQPKQVSFSCLIRTYISLSLKNIWGELNDLSTEDINEIFTSFILYVRALKIVEKKLKSKNQKTTIDELIKIEVEIDSLTLELQGYLKMQCHIEKHYFFLQHHKTYHVKLEQDRRKLQAQKKRLKNELGKIISILKNIETSVCHQYDNIKNKKIAPDRQPENQKKTRSPEQNKYHKKTKKRGESSLHPLSRTNDFNSNTDEKPLPPVTQLPQYTEETNRCQTLLSEEATPLLNQVDNLLISIDQLKESPNCNANIKKNVSTKRNILITAAQSLRHWQNELKKRRPIQLHEKKVLKNIQILKETIEKTKQYIAQQTKVAIKPSTKSQKNKAQVKPEKTIVSPSVNAGDDEEVDSLSMATPALEPSSKQRGVKNQTIEINSDAPPPSPENTTTEPECKISDNSSATFKPEDAIPFSLFSKPTHHGINPIQAARPSWHKHYHYQYQLFPPFR